jgi:hypothetical protein
MFDVKAQERLGYYVYALFESGEPAWPFYIGKGCGNRVFSHARGEAVQENEDDPPLSQKLEHISSIKRSSRTVLHKIIRFALSEEEAFKIEASLIDLVNHIKPDTLKNEISGQGVAEGFYDANDLATSLCAKDLESDFPLLVIKIERRWSELLAKHGAASSVPLGAIYDATKGDWKLKISRAQRAECVLAVARGLVRAVFVPSGWSDAADKYRKVMNGQSDSTKFQHLVGTSVAHLFERGSQNPVRYLRC